MEIFFTHSEANWFPIHGLFRVTAFSIYNRKREVEPGILIQMGWGCNGLKNFSKGLRDVKEGGISATKRQPKCGDCAWRKSTLHVRLNGRVTLTVGRALLQFFLYKNEKKKKKKLVRKLATRVVFPNIFQSFVMFCFTILGSQVDLYFWYECQTTLQVQQKIKSRLPVEIYVKLRCYYCGRIMGNIGGLEKY